MAEARQTGPEPGRRRRRLPLRDIVLLVMLGVVFGFLYWALVQAWNGLAVAMGPAGDLAQHVLLGGWLLVAPLAIAIVRKPFVGVIAEVIASVVEVVFLGSPVGPLLLRALAVWASDGSVVLVAPAVAQDRARLERLIADERVDAPLG